ncbi:hypothetical protein HGA13_15525 [Nocardia speluncae]|uniref:Uncharacterized protein n=1 Tax=Nocardia speluncae TaxID=419477 RepID=A0A846XDL0_9NOCA|nr:hypothetical protein [Nocardia speluncae]NKY34471.1 hypothetical protein [Nocardia speluncae]
MPSAVSQAAARARLLRYLTGILRLLPPETALLLQHPDLPAAGFHHGVTLPAEDTPDGEREFFDISYWVAGADPEDSDVYFDLVMRAWTELDPQARPDRPMRPRTGYARTSDGYGLTVTQSVTGYLSVSGSTPPFGSDTPEGEPFPSRIEHPGDNDR